MSFLTSFAKYFAYVSFPLIILSSFTARTAVGRYYLRQVLYLSTLSIVSVYGAASSIALALVGQRFNINWVVARTFYNVAGRALGIRFEVENEHVLANARPAILLGNHQSMLDILFLARIFPKRASITAKRELAWAPFLGQYLAASGAVFIDRSNNVNAIKSLAAAGDAMKRRDTSLWMFPEGTRTLTKEHKLLPFKKGAFHLAVQAGVPLVPVICENYWRLYHPGVFESGVLRIRVLEPIPTSGLTAADVPELAEKVHALMEDALRSISTDREPERETPQPTLHAASSSDIREIRSEVRPARDVSESSSSLDGAASRRRVDSEAGSVADTGSTAETDDEGIVHVRRPT